MRWGGRDVGIIDVNQIYYKNQELKQLGRPSLLESSSAFIKCLRNLLTIQCIVHFDTFIQCTI